jgi:hypothetical protein
VVDRNGLIKQKRISPEMCLLESKYPFGSLVSIVEEASPHRLIQTISKSKLQTEQEMKTIANRVQLLKRQDERMQYQIRK